MLFLQLKEVKSLKCELERNLEDLKEQLEHALRVSDHTSNKLMKKNSYIEQGKLSRVCRSNAICLPLTNAPLSAMNTRWPNWILCTIPDGIGIPLSTA